LILGWERAHVKIAELHLDDIVCSLELIVLSDGSDLELVINVDLDDVFFGRENGLDNPDDLDFTV
jgi:hypothetical protein